jgi:psp operon transcriptional activator
MASNEAPAMAATVTAAAAGPDAPTELRAAVFAYERQLLEAALVRHRHNQRATAKALGLTYDQLRHCLKKHGLLDGAV